MHVYCSSIMFHLLDNTSVEEGSSESGSIGSKTHDLEETLERRVRADSNTSNFMRCLGGILKALIKWYIWVRNKDHMDSVYKWQTLKMKILLKNSVTSWIRMLKWGTTVKWRTLMLLIQLLVIRFVMNIKTS